jgi:hypothetical protein
MIETTPMTQRYDLLLDAIRASNEMTLFLFLAALLALTTYPVLSWTPPIVRRIAQPLYIVFLLALSILSTVYFAG